MGETKGETFLYFWKNKKRNVLCYLFDLQYFEYFMKIVRIVFFGFIESRPDRF
jgi:hypothetical protein